VFKLRNLFANCMIVIKIYGKFKMTATQYISLALKGLNIESYLRIWRTSFRKSKSYVKRKTFMFLLYLIMNCPIEDKMAVLPNKIWQYNRD
jgi:hypothetical protein